MKNARIAREILDLLNMKVPLNDGIHPGYRQIRVIHEEVCATSSPRTTRFGRMRLHRNFWLAVWYE